jgi:Gamma interferon inducible lysosomal thiol reductase (GILT)
MLENKKSFRAILTLAAIILFGCGQGTDTPKAEPAPVKQEIVEGAVNISIFIMSQCPYSGDVIEALAEIKEKLGNMVHLKIDYMGINFEKSDRDFGSMHGKTEVAGNIIQLCAASVAPNNHLKMLDCMFDDISQIPGNWKACADKAGISQADIIKCKDGDHGKSLLKASFKYSNEESKAVASPHIIINNKPYMGPRVFRFLAHVTCKNFKDEQRPAACDELLSVHKIKATFISDKRCKDCNTEKLVTKLKNALPGLVPRVLDWSEDEAKQLAKNAGIKLLPAVLFDKDFNPTKESIPGLEARMFAAGEYKILKNPAFFDPTQEICDNEKDDTGNGKVDCLDPGCTEAITCRPAKKKHLDLFIMSQCKHGLSAQLAMKELLVAFEGEIEFGVHYVAEERNGEFLSVHGPTEVEEDIRALCAMAHYPENNKYLDYLWCRAEDIIDPDWQKCTTKIGIDEKVIQDCRTGEEGQSLLLKNIELARRLKIPGSPTWLVNNQTIFKAITPEKVQQNYCAKNEGLKGCRKLLSKTPLVPENQKPGVDHAHHAH